MKLTDLKDLRVIKKSLSISPNATHPRPDIWSKIPPKKEKGQDGTTIEDIML